MTFLKIWLSLFIVGLVFFPLTASIMKNFKDRGWLFSKIIGICISAWTIWFISSLKILPYTTLISYIVIFIYAIVNFFIIVFKYKKEPFKFKKIFLIIKSSLKEFCNNIDSKLIKQIIISELIFIIVFAFWSYIKGFHPEINNSTEQFMDYGYMNATMNSKYMPPTDIWLSGNTINYYYYGQYISGFICKIANTNASWGYNYILAFVATCTFTLPFSIGYNLFKVKYTKKKSKKQIIIPIIAAISMGLAVSIAGSMHYPIYRWFSPIEENYSYIDETRYIGYKPEVEDKTATEVPAYSTLVGDLHAHYVDLVFSLALVGLLAEYFIKEKEDEVKKTHLVLIALLLGICKMTNYWDYPIYIVIISAMFVGKKLVCGKCDKKRVLNTIGDILKVIVVEQLITLPFTLNLYVGSTQVYFTGITSPFHKMLVKWGLPTFVSLFFLTLFLIYPKINKIKYKKYFKEHLPQVFMIILSLCALGLVLLPEIVYLKDIYNDEYKRFNTMFKLTYQAFMLFGICISYFLLQLSLKKGKLLKGIAISLFIIYSTTFIYGIDTMITLYDNMEHVGISDTTTEQYIKDNLPSDYEAIKWIRENIDRDKVILEHTEYGNSYKMSSRISTFTGNPTVLGWSYHEWIWRADETHQLPAVVILRNNDVSKIYNTDDVDEAKDLLKTYDVSYIYIGNMELETYTELNIDLLKSLGETVYEKDNSYLIKVK